MRYKLCTSILLLCCILFSTLGYAQSDYEQSSSKLQTLKQRILSLTSRLHFVRDKRANLLGQLKKTEKNIGKLSKNVISLSQQIRIQKRQLNKLRKQSKQLNTDLNHQNSMLAKQFRAAYQLGEHDYLKLLLNQDDPNAINDMLVYYRYFNQARFKLIQKIQTLLDESLKNEQAIITKTAFLQQLQKEKNKQRSLLTNANSKQKRVLHRLNRQIHSKQQYLHTLISNKRSLENLLQQLKSSPKAILDAASPFSKMRHRLSWPTKGKLQQHFSQKIRNTKIRSSGVFIKAPDGQAVRAIHPGRVVFSDWLRGFGMLIIVEHNQGYMSLYGHNSSLYRKVGDVVKNGDLLARVGHSGGIQESGLYFEIRHKGKPINPQRWCIKFA